MAQRLVFVSLLALAGMVAIAPRTAHRLVGLAPLQAPTAAAIDDPAELDERAAPRFLAERDRLELTVREDTTVGALLRRYHIPYEHIRRQIGAQIGVERPADDQPLAAGQVLELTLTTPREPGG